MRDPPTGDVARLSQAHKGHQVQYSSGHSRHHWPCCAGSQSLTISEVVQLEGLICVSFPLTPALSLRERGNPSQRFGTSNRAGLADGLAATLPLPNPGQSGLRSEGWGGGG